MAKKLDVANNKDYNLQQKKIICIAIQSYRYSEQTSPSACKVEHLDCLTLKTGKFSPDDTALPLQQDGRANRKPRKPNFIFILCILNNKCLLYALSPLLFNFALECTIRRVQVNQDGLKLNGTHQLLAYADNVNILGGSLHTVHKNA